MDYAIVHKDDLLHYGKTYAFEGYQFGGGNISFIMEEMPPGSGPRLHSHPYEEVFIMQEGKATFTIGSDTKDVEVGLIVIVPPDVPHKFVNRGDGPLHQVTIHASKKMITNWLED